MPTAALDFDGTIHPYTRGWQGVGIVDPEPPDPDLEFVLQSLIDAGCTLVVHSCRAVDPEGMIAFAGWLEAHRLSRFFTKITSEKPAALVYLDDRAVRFTGDWWAARDAVLDAMKG